MSRRENRVIRRAGWIACAAFAAAATLAQAARDWGLVDIGTLGGPGSYGAAVSNSGYVAGCADDAAGGTHAFLYRDGRIEDLGTANGTAGGNSCALAVNDSGVAAGRSGAGELVIWSGGSIAHLGIEGNIGGIDGAGMVVGTRVEGASSRAFMYARGAVTTLGTLGGDDPAGSSGATALNARGEIVGSSNGHAVVFEDGMPRDLGSLGGSSSAAKGINDGGQVVGMATDAHGAPLPFLYDGSMRALPGPGYSSAIAINNRGQVVGSGEGIYGYLLDGGTLTRLDTIPAVVARGWRHLEPTGISDRGWIVGTAVDGDGNLRAFLLVPPGQAGALAAVKSLRKRVAALR
jgi:probable HAF family extracellular repeat protein